MGRTVYKADLSETWVLSNEVIDLVKLMKYLKLNQDKRIEDEDLPQEIRDIIYGSLEINSNLRYGGHTCSINTDDYTAFLNLEKNTLRVDFSFYD